MKKLKNNINNLLVDCVRPDQLENLEELQAIYDNRQSFYKKAYVGEYTFPNNVKIIYLKSYNTIVASFWINQLNEPELRIYGYFSQTTARHIREFAKQNGFDGEITAQDLKNTCVFSK